VKYFLYVCHVNAIIILSIETFVSRKGTLVGVQTLVSRNWPNLRKFMFLKFSTKRFVRVYAHDFFFHL